MIWLPTNYPIWFHLGLHCSELCIVFISFILSSFRSPILNLGTSLVAQTGKESACIVGHLVQSLGWEDLLEKGMATYSSILAWRIPWTEEPGGLQSMGLQRDRHFALSAFLYFLFSCLQTYMNPLPTQKRTLIWTCWPFWPLCCFFPSFHSETSVITGPYSLLSLFQSSWTFLTFLSF